jgi:hypothetical protein
MLSPRILTTPVAPALMVMPYVLEARMLASVPRASIVMERVMRSDPNPAGSNAPISPPVVVFENAPAKVLQGASRVHGFASSPTPETHVFMDCAFEGTLKTSTAVTPIRRMPVARFILYKVVLRTQERNVRVLHKVATRG